MKEPTHFNGYPIFKIVPPGHLNCKCVPGMIHGPEDATGKPFPTSVTGKLSMHFEPGAFEMLSALFGVPANDKPMTLLREVDRYVHDHLGCSRSETSAKLVVWMAKHLQAGKVVMMRKDILPQ